MRDDLRAFDCAHDMPSLQYKSNACQKILHLRVLATTDIHMQFLGHDYFRDRPVDHHGLAGLATLVKEARSEAQASDVGCVLLDNGDLLQGTALGATLSREQIGCDHPVVKCLDAMGYDAVGVGNHDLDFGLAYPKQLAALSSTPFICSNLQFAERGPVQRYAILSRRCIDSLSGQPVELRIGVMSVLPELTALWNQPALRSDAQVISGRAAVADTAAELRRNGADVIILLAHLGIEDMMLGRDDARTMAAEPGIDAVIAGHTHRRLPGQDHAGFTDVDVTHGRLADCPAIMPGFDASDLGVLDLKFGQVKDGAWHVLAHHADLRANTKAIAPDAKITAICAPAHMRTRQELAEEIGQTEKPLHNFFSLAMPTQTCAIVACAKKSIVRRGLKNLPEAELPLLATVSAHTAGGFNGPDHFLHIPEGPILRRHVAGLNPHANQVCALRVTGHEVLRWLEHAATVFDHLGTGAGQQELKLAHRPAYDFDTIYGLNYRIDPTRPAGNRISQLTYETRPVRSDQIFVLATNQFRAAGGGGGPAFNNQQFLFDRPISLSQALQDVLTSPAPVPWLQTHPWQFCCAQPVQTILRTAPQALSFLDDISHLAPEPLGTDPAGFAKIRLNL